MTKNAVIQIYNLLGELIYQERIISDMQNEINLKAITDGVYLLKVLDEKKYCCSKIIADRD